MMNGIGIKPEVYELELLIAPQRLDPVYHHLHHAEMFKILEEARIGYLAAIGLPQEELIQQDCFLVLSSANVRFLREMKAEQVRCSVSVLSIEESGTFTLFQQILKHPKRVALEGEIALTAMSGT
ncbi:MAG: acyl-CoA thioesterase, partial [Bdellovibrionales bacterium]|nr:acyl-CoA thioesterase [Bdellovibrionales bacterium]